MQFMSIAILENCINHKKAGYVPVRHATHHDLESVVWVAEYALFRRAYLGVLKLPEKNEIRTQVEELFRKEFGRVTPEDISITRSATAGWKTASSAYQMVELRLFDEQLLEFLPMLGPAVEDQNPSRNAHHRGWWRTVRKEDQKPETNSKLLTCDEMKLFLEDYAATFHIF